MLAALLYAINFPVSKLLDQVPAAMMALVIMIAGTYLASTDSSGG